jgi:hypothetical protein
MSLDGTATTAVSPMAMDLDNADVCFGYSTITNNESI